jgi:hypothetical protein
MPSSRCNHIPIVLGIVQQLAPRSILDVGVGFGKWGHLFREYTDIRLSELEPLRYQREHWQVRIDGIEGHAPYLTPMHQYLYNQIHVGDMREKIHEVGTYDLIFLGDVLEHVTHSDGEFLLQACMQHAEKAVVVTTPSVATPQAGVCANPLEMHRCVWRADEFRTIGRCVTRVDDNETLVAVLLKEGVPEPQCIPPRRASVVRRSGLWKQALGGSR